MQFVRVRSIWRILATQLILVLVLGQQSPFSSELIEQLKAAKARDHHQLTPMQFFLTGHFIAPSQRAIERNSNRQTTPTFHFEASLSPSTFDDSNPPDSPQQELTTQRRVRPIRFQRIISEEVPAGQIVASSVDENASDDATQQVRVIMSPPRSPPRQLQFVTRRKKRVKKSTTTTTTTESPEDDDDEQEDESTTVKTTTQRPTTTTTPTTPRTSTTPTTPSTEEDSTTEEAFFFDETTTTLQPIATAQQFSRKKSNPTAEDLSTTATSLSLIRQSCLATAEGAPKVPLDNPFSGPLPECAKLKYRSFDGTCNNIAFPDRGATDAVLLRTLEPNYADGQGMPRISISKAVLPSAREVSKRVGGDADVSSLTTTQMFMQFGQFIDHDVTNTARMQGIGGGTPQCCFEDATTKLDPACFPIQIPQDDAVFSPLKQTCLEFVRSLAGHGPGCNRGPREQTNQNTAFIDGSAIYGLSSNRANILRSKKLGMLKTFTPDDNPHYNLLPRNPTNSECVQPTKTQMCFKAGDIRANVHLGIAQMQTLWLRQHNRVAETLHDLNPNWDDEKLYEEARRITGAQLQHIAYKEFLPVLLGDEITNKWGLRLLNEGRFTGYNISLNPGILNEFATAAYRVGHTMVPKAFRKSSKDYKIRSTVSVKSTYFHPFTLYDKDGFDEVIFGMVSSPSNEVDVNFVDDLNDHLFQAPGETSGLDLTAINIQRGRDHGVAGWMKWRQICGLPVASSFEELKRLNAIPDDVASRMEEHYDDVADVDLYIAGAAENHVTGGMVGPTFACLIAEQFRRLKMGDRFWYENDLPLASTLSDDQLEDIRKTSMAQILCDNTPLMDSIQRQAFLLPNPRTNPVVSCKSLPQPTYNT
ncbi:Chorion peroxidase [Hypsibius exemplaris]|uniref:Chorion peroxidase n=1 Tax=Hypsibius exemplaris TaxID=2072580 RepID=A0A9X6NGL8_HYPEX|nr:Chorion peroxidase [Hypsibius exemplaris]